MLPPNLDSVKITSKMNITFDLDGMTVGSYNRTTTAGDGDAANTTFGPSLLSVRVAKRPVCTF